MDKLPEEDTRPGQEEEGSLRQEEAGSRQRQEENMAALDQRLDEEAHTLPAEEVRRLQDMEERQMAPALLGFRPNRSVEADRRRLVLPEHRAGRTWADRHPAVDYQQDRIVAWCRLLEKR